MRSVLLIVGMSLLLASFVSAQCEAEPSIGQTGKIIRTLSFDQKKTSELGLSIKASVDRASWQTTGAEAAVITVFVNKKYEQDVILFGGSQMFDYEILIGELVAGRYTIDLVWNSVRSAKGAGRVSISSAKTFAVEPTKKVDQLGKLAVMNSPVIYVRPNAVDKFSDIPLVTYYEIFPESENAGKIRYTTIFSNEDGGTQTAALMARWGRATDIEWIYEFSYSQGQIISESYQGANHTTTIFRGKRIIGRHPQFLTLTENNNFADSGCSALRIVNVPLSADLSVKSRETIMDENPWTYRVMGQEAIREGRVDPANTGANVIDDPRNYLYVEVYTENEGTAVSVEVRTIDGAKNSSDLGDERLRVARGGFQRIAVRLPSFFSRLKSVALKCHSALADKSSGTCGNSRIVRLIALDRNYTAKSLNMKKTKRRWLLPNEELVGVILSRQASGRWLYARKRRLRYEGHR